MAATNSRSSKFLHGGLRYLENLGFRLIREALRERDARLRRASELARPLRLLIPMCQASRRPCWLVRAGLFLYERMAGQSALPASRWCPAEEMLAGDPDLLADGLLGGYAFFDGQMDDRRRGLCVARQAMDAGAVRQEGCEVSSVDGFGKIRFADGTSYRHDRLINVRGPWAEQLLRQSGNFLSLRARPRPR